MSDFSRTPAPLTGFSTSTYCHSSANRSARRAASLHAEPLAGVVPGGDEVDPELARRRRVRLLGLAGEQRVVPRCAATTRSWPAARRDREAADLRSPPRRTRGAARPRLPRAQRGRRARSGRAWPSPTAPNCSTGVARSAPRGCALLPSSGCASSARWYATSEAFGAEERLQPTAEPGVDDERLVSPEEPVVHEHDSAGAQRPAEQFPGARDPAGDRVTSAPPTTCSPCGANSGNRSISRSSFAYRTISSLAATARVYGRQRRGDSPSVVRRVPAARNDPVVERYPEAARGVAQPGSALRSGRRGPQFESGHPDSSAAKSARTDSRRGIPARSGALPEGVRCRGRNDLLLGVGRAVAAPRAILRR